MTLTSTGASMAIFDMPIDMEAVNRIIAQVGGDDQPQFYELETPQGIRRVPRVSSILDGLGSPWIARWVSKVDRESFRAAAVALVAP
jgi:hypothetical protein